MKRTTTIALLLSIIFFLFSIYIYLLPAEWEFDCDWKIIYTRESGAICLER